MFSLPSPKVCSHSLSGLLGWTLSPGVRIHSLCPVTLGSFLGCVNGGLAIVSMCVCGSSLALFLMISDLTPALWPKRFWASSGLGWGEGNTQWGNTSLSSFLPSLYSALGYWVLPTVVNLTVLSFFFFFQIIIIISFLWLRLVFVIAHGHIGS